MITLNEAKQALAILSPFNAGNLTAVSELDTAKRELVYKVFSYSTEIARLTNDTNGSVIWITATKYSQTTSKHANIIKRAWDLL